MRRPASRYQYVRREPTVGEYAAMIVPAVLVAGIGYLGLLLLIGAAGPGVSAVVWVCGFLALGGVAHARPALLLLRWGWLVAGGLVALTV
ncbi:hypothetical protein LO772_04570 [Yinghuangia sp. ASG 101]|uniref:hypothetical protein n=1 Tax=Yinghuangia sp. ASG 101 TaxID=2896848 RepID=UPI001E2BF77F|nr:hypothetical protein [Yinghuangia sp. ASG 101]UGQ12898.1 hypothetical protein LO772_04570 [Yinghuangia sp. ASG 101]